MHLWCSVFFVTFFGDCQGGKAADLMYVDRTCVKILSAVWLILGIPSLLESREVSEESF